MKKISAIAAAALILAVVAVAQTQTPPPANTPATATPAPAQPAHAPGLKAPPQAKSQEEYNAFLAAAKNAEGSDPAAAEAAARDFQAKFPASELTSQLYMTQMLNAIRGNDSDRAVEMGRAVLKLDPTNPVAAVYTALVLAEVTRETDLDAAQKFEEATKDANIGLQNVDTNLVLAANAPEEAVAATKADLKARAYDTLGLIAFKRNDFVAAEKNFRQSLQVGGEPGEAMTHLRLALSLDKQNRYNEALPEAQKAASLANPQDSVARSAQAEIDRLKNLGASGTTATPAAQPAAPPKTK